jgi:hypothetical protein
VDHLAPTGVPRTSWGYCAAVVVAPPRNLTLGSSESTSTEPGILLSAPGKPIF